jgi:trans-aconitate methyltransferase
MEFDRYSKNYDTVLQDAVKTTGYDASHFTTAKLKKLKDLLKSDTAFNFLDYGCGPGNLCRDFQQYFPKARYFGVDVSPEMIKQARAQYGGKGNFYEISSEEWKHNSYQVIFSACVFHHIPHENHKTILAELKNLLASSGEIILWEHNPTNPFTRKVVRDCPFDKDAVLLHPHQSTRLFTQAGLQHVRLIYTTFFPKFLQALSPLENWLEWCPLGGQYILRGKKI